MLHIRVTFVAGGGDGELQKCYTQQLNRQQKGVQKNKKKFHYVCKWLDYGIPGTQRKTCKLLPMYVSLNIYKKLFNIIFIQLFCFMDRHFFFKL